MNPNECGVAGPTVRCPPFSVRHLNCLGKQRRCSRPACTNAMPMVHLPIFELVLGTHEQKSETVGVMIQTEL